MPKNKTDFPGVAGEIAGLSETNMPREAMNCVACILMVVVGVFVSALCYVGYLVYTSMGG